MLKQPFIHIIIGLILSVIIGCSDKVELHPIAENTTILAFGDSLTYGTGTSRDKSYPAVLEKLTHHKVVNAGKPGEISAKGLLRLPTLIKQYQPGLIIICHGGNDILRKLDLNITRHNIQQMIDLARQQNIQVILIGVPEFGLFLNTASIYNTLAEQNNIPYLRDTIGNILAESSLKSDRIHPNAKGYKRLATDITMLLRESGAIKYPR
ncbi:MAG: arylesterase [Gammaproteobacteria bacterium]|nr:arylesterase [Gammaproteobacteria bacterium]